MMKTQLVISGENDNYSIVFQATEVVDGETVVVTSDVRSGLTKAQLLAAAQVALTFIEEN
jgi:ATP adenylyltransferase/5',5'''-P-1,P-4-tetraphosphate phosphorylase II